MFVSHFPEILVNFNNQFIYTFSEKIINLQHYETLIWSYIFGMLINNLMYFLASKFLLLFYAKVNEFEF